MSLVVEGLLQLAKSAAFWIEKLVLGEYATQSLRHITGLSEAGLGLNQFNRTLHNAEKGSSAELKLLLIEMSELRAELPAPQVSKLYRFLCRDQVSLELLRLVTSTEERDPRETTLVLEDVRAKKMLSYVASNAIAYGPSYVLVSVCRTEEPFRSLLRYFEGDPEALDSGVTTNVCQVVFAALNLKPLWTLMRMDEVGSFIHNLVKHIAHEAVADLLTHFLDKRESMNRFFGTTDRLVRLSLSLICHENIFDLLASAFIAAIELENVELSSSKTIENSCHVFANVAYHLQNDLHHYITEKSTSQLNIFLRLKPLTEIFNAGLNTALRNELSGAPRESLRLFEDMIVLGTEANGVDRSATTELELFLRTKTSDLLALLQCGRGGLPDAIEGIPIREIRLEISRFFGTCFRRCSQEHVEHLVTSDTIGEISRLCSSYPNASLLHSQWLRCVMSVLTRGNMRTIRILFREYNFLHLLLQIWRGASVQDFRRSSFASAAVDVMVEIAQLIHDANFDESSQELASVVSSLGEPYESFNQTLFDIAHNQEEQEALHFRGALSLPSKGNRSPLEKYVGTPQPALFFSNAWHT
uniref:Uncharacterized protein n=1 Tax=Rhodosorus marinus TaxID=101924 RepID=A0A7S0BLE6_9RHOD|mmetsp:Transcript_22458/g.32334  ORF Transcript_22458/g.32334 Transcript_22458/m.32334 type:complete len:585 (+) Transcript_22458:293-2047(+)